MIAFKVIGLNLGNIAKFGSVIISNIVSIGSIALAVVLLKVCDKVYVSLSFNGEKEFVFFPVLRRGQRMVSSILAEKNTNHASLLKPPKNL